MIPSLEDSRPDYSVVVPVYNSTESLRELYEQLKEVFGGMLEADFELVFVDDGSPNRETWPALEALSLEDSRIRAFQLMRNAGQQNATMCGLIHARGRRVLIMDDDLQHRPEEIPKLARKLDEDNTLDVIFARPVAREHSAARNLGSFLFGKLMSILIQKPKGIRFSSFILMHDHLRDAMTSYGGHRITICSLICMNTPNIANVEVDASARRYGKSGYTLSSLVRLAFNHMFNFSSLPLKAMSIGGAVVAALSMLYAAYIFYERLNGRIGSAGFASTVILISFYSGLLLTSMGIVGQYMVRILRATTYGQQFALRQTPDDIASRNAPTLKKNTESSPTSLHLS